MSTTGGTTVSNPLTVTAPEGLPFVEFEREFDAPPEAVLQAHADPELLRRWTGPIGHTMAIESWDFTSQGRYRSIHHGPDGDSTYPSEARDGMVGSSMEQGMSEGYECLDGLLA